MEKKEVARFELVVYRNDIGLHSYEVDVHGSNLILIAYLSDSVQRSTDVKEIVKAAYELSL